MAPIDVRAGLTIALKRLVRDPREWPIRDRRRFRNLLLDAVTSDAMPLAELLLRVHDDGLLREFPEATAPRARWDAAAARLSGDLQSQRFVEPGVARFVADAWIGALGPDVIPVVRVATPRPVVTPRPAVRSSATTSAAAYRAAPPSTVQSSAASIKAYNRSNVFLMVMAAVFTIGMILAFRQTARRRAAPTVATVPASLPVPAPQPAADAATDSAPPATVPPATVPRESSTVASAAMQAPVQPPAVPEAPQNDPVDVAPARARTTDDIVLAAGRVFEGRVLSVRQQSILVKDEETGLDFEIAKSDIDRIVTREGRVMRFGADNIPLIGDDDDLTPVTLAGRYRVRYAERWGAERSVCSDVARRFAPGAELVVRHLRGAPVLKIEFPGGAGFNGAVRSDGLFETTVAQALARGPESSFVSTRLSGRLSRGGVLQGVARLSAVRADGVVVCDLALTMRGERLP